MISAFHMFTKKSNLISKSMSYIYLDYDMFVMEDLL